MAETARNPAYIAPVLRVANIARSIAFYRDQLGFNVDFVHEGFYASVSRQGCRLHLKCAPPIPRDQAGLEREEHIDACVVGPGIAALAAQFTSAGVALLVPLRRMAYGTEFYVRDPDGYVLGFIQPEAE